MASPRFFADPLSPVAFYHCISRVVDRRLVMFDEEREHFVRLMRAYEAFCQVRVLAYCVMSNHFHILVEVRKRPESGVFSDEWVVAQAAQIYSKVAVRELRDELADLRKQGHSDAADELKERYLGRMWDVSQFMKELKQRYSLWHNKRVGRKGTLWEERFTSVLLEGEMAALSVMSAYIDLNPVRAGMVTDPKDYRWCGYAEAVAGGRKALTALDTVTREHRAHEPAAKITPSKKVLEGYRLWLFGQGMERRDKEGGKVIRKGFQRKAVEEVQEQKGALSFAETLRCRVRYFSRGAVLGSRAFVDEYFETHREQFGAKRKTGARPMRELADKALYSMRALSGAVEVSR